MVRHSTPSGQIPTDPLVGEVRGGHGESFNLGRRDQVKIEWPGVTECDVGICGPEVIQDFGNLNFRMRTTGSKYRGRHGNLSGALLNEVFYGRLQGRSAKFVIGQSEQHALELGREPCGDSLEA